VIVNKSEKVRLQKVIANRGLCSRRKAEERIRQGEVWVNGKIAYIGQKVDACKDHIFVGKKPILPTAPKRQVLVLNKPKGFICSNNDPFHKENIFGLLPYKYRRERLFCVGRLDKDSEGLVILTNDGELAHHIMHPSHRVIKRYRVTLNKHFDIKLIPKLLTGVHSDGEWLKVDRVIPPTRSSNDVRTLEVVLSHGRKRELRRLFEAFQYRVKRLTRFQIGRIGMNRLPSGAVRSLSEHEIKQLWH